MNPLTLRPRKRAGFTLLEIMLVVTIIAVLLAAAVHYMGGNVEYAQDVRIKADLDTISTQLLTYRSMTGFLPTTDQGLQALVTRPDTDPKPSQWIQLMPKLPEDPWHNPYVYVNPGTHNPNSYDLYTLGPHGKAGTAAEQQGNWDAGK
jgi:general secretion pathway protein G